MTWRNAAALVALRNGVNARWPKRDKASDGTIGDAAHASRSSDHNPWVVVNGVGVVRALDIDVDGINAAWYAEELRKLGAAGDHRLAGGGYVIFNNRITASDFKSWRKYTGSNPHTKHVHVSLSRNRAGFDDPAPWKFLGAPTAPPPAPVKPPSTTKTPPFPLARGYYYGPLDGPKASISGRHRSDTQAMRDGLRRWQQRMRERGWQITPDGTYGPQTRNVALAFQREKRLAADGLIGPQTWAAAWTAPIT